MTLAPCTEGLDASLSGHKRATLLMHGSNHKGHDEDKGPGNSAPQVLKPFSFFDSARPSGKWAMSSLSFRLRFGPGAYLLQAPRRLWKIWAKWRSQPTLQDAGF